MEAAGGPRAGRDPITAASDARAAQVVGPTEAAIRGIAADPERISSRVSSRGESTDQRCLSLCHRNSTSSPVRYCAAVFLDSANLYNA